MAEHVTLFAIAFKGDSAVPTIVAVEAGRSGPHYTYQDAEAGLVRIRCAEDGDPIGTWALSREEAVRRAREALTENRRQHLVWLERANSRLAALTRWYDGGLQQ